MRILHFVFILAAAILLKNVYCDSSNPLPNASPPPPPRPQVTSYILAVSWPPGVCNGQSNVTCKIKPVPTEFTIHGLWQQPNGSGTPSTEAFDANKLTPISTELEKNWPNLESAQQSISVNIIFWQHEWTEHGKYSGLGLRQYFDKSLQLLNDFQGLKARLDAEKIKPTIYNTYKLADIQAAVTRINGGFSGTIICVQRKDTSNRQQIQEIRFRYTTQFGKQNNLSPSNCGTDILFPSTDLGLAEVVSMPEVHHHPL